MFPFLACVSGDLIKKVSIKIYIEYFSCGLMRIDLAEEFLKTIFITQN